MSTFDIDRFFKEGISKHISDTDLGLYHDNALKYDIKRVIIEKHLSQCLICSQRLSIMEDVLERFDKVPATSEDRAHVEALIDKYRETRVSLKEKFKVALANLAEYIQESMGSILSLDGAYAAELTGEIEGETEDGIFFWSVTEDEGELTLDISSFLTDLDGMTLRLRIGSSSIQKEITLERKEEDQVVARVKFSREERKGLPQDPSITLEPLES